MTGVNQSLPADRFCGVSVVFGINRFKANTYIARHWGCQQGKKSAGGWSSGYPQASQAPQSPGFKTPLWRANKLRGGCPTPDPSSAENLPEPAPYHVSASESPSGLSAVCRGCFWAFLTHFGSSGESWALLATSSSVCCPVQPGDRCPRQGASPALGYSPSAPSRGHSRCKQSEAGGFLCLIDIIKGAVSMFTLETATAV